MKDSESETISEEELAAIGALLILIHFPSNDN